MADGGVVRGSRGASPKKCRRRQSRFTLQRDRADRTRGSGRGCLPSGLQGMIESGTGLLNSKLVPSVATAA